MRILEVVLSIANILTLCTLIIPRLTKTRWTGYAVLAGLIMVVIQIVVEGPRWQMIPAYSLTIIFLLIWLIGRVIKGGIQIHRVIYVLVDGFGVLMLAISIVLPILLPVFHFPKPTGPYAIGTMTFHWVDKNRLELFTPNPNAHRELMAQIWYPATNEPWAPRSPYIQDSGSVTSAASRLLNLPGFFFSHLKYVTTDAVTAAPISEAKSTYPVLIYLTGVDGFPSVSTFQIENLVSHGYIVVGLDQPGVAASVRFPDGRQIFGWPRNQIQPLIDQSVEPQPKAPALLGKALPDGIVPYFAQDVSFTLDQLTNINKSDPNHILTGRLDLEHIGTFGVSLGGMNAAEASLKDPRLKACLIMDVWMPSNVVKAGLKQPTMFITRDADTMRLERRRAGGWSEHDIALTLNTMKEVYNNLTGDGYYLQIPNMFHVNFTDLPYWSPVMSLVGMTGPINGQRGFDIVNAYSLAFFDKELKGQVSPLLDGHSKQFPEVDIAILRH